MFIYYYTKFYLLLYIFFKYGFITIIQVGIIIYHIFIYYNINKGIKQKNYSKYNKGLILSLIYSIIATFSKIIFFFIFFSSFSFYDDSDDDNLEKGSSSSVSLLGLIVLLIFFYIFFDWLLTIIILCYNQKIKNLCSNNINNMLLTTPVNQPNLYIPNNFNQTNMINNQNLNGYYVQPYYPNLNAQPNVQKINGNYVQPIYPNVNAQSNTQNLNNNEVTSTGNIQ